MQSDHNCTFVERNCVENVPTKRRCLNDISNTAPIRCSATEFQLPEITHIGGCKRTDRSLNQQAHACAPSFKE